MMFSSQGAFARRQWNESCFLRFPIPSRSCAMIWRNRSKDWPPRNIGALSFSSRKVLFLMLWLGGWRRKDPQSALTSTCGKWLTPEFVLLRGERPLRPSDTTKPRLSGASSFLTGCRTRGFIRTFPLSSSKTGEKSIRFLTACRRTSLNFEHFMSRHSDGGSIGCHPLL